MSCFSDIDLASNDPPELKPMLALSSALFGSLGLIVAAMNVGEDEASACAAQSGVSKPSSAKPIQGTTNSGCILNGRFNWAFATKSGIRRAKASYRTDSLMGCHRIAFGADDRQTGNYQLINT
jgi:hypothetical protein